MSPPRWRGTLKTLYYSASAGYEDYLNGGFAILPPPLGKWAQPHTRYNGSIGPKEMSALFVPGDSGTGSIIKLTVTTVYEVLQRPPKKWERELMHVNRGYVQWSVAAIILGLNSLDPLFRDVIINEWHMHWVPLVEWKDDFKTWITALRRCPIVSGHPELGPDVVLQLRKVFNCTYRAKMDADWEAEKHRRQENTPVHLGINSKGERTRGAWELELDRHLKQVTMEVVSKTISDARLDTLDDWWQSRWAWSPSGSSSQRHRADALKNTDERLKSAARPNKKSVFEELPDDYMRALVNRMPYMYVARASTKHEPGGKFRALYAAVDEAFLIASYASVHLEKHMNLWGIKAKQTPADVVEWIASGLRRKGNEVWVSLDYSDYNSDHELNTLSRLNLWLARAWNKLAAGRAYRHDKMECAFWAARAHQSAWVTGPDTDEVWRVFGGLFSGDRDTARDNTLLHGVYSRMAMKFTQYVDPAAKLVTANYTGDDEDSLLNDWVAAHLYLAMHGIMEFELKPAKQLVSKIVHEFLQRMAGMSCTPTRPMFAMLAQLASGNWYKDVYIWYDSAIQSVSDNVWELVSRGMPISYGRRLAVEVLNATMRVPISKGERTVKGCDYTERYTEWKRLEWWKFRNNGATVHPLWYGTGDATDPVPIITAKPRPGAAASCFATKAWISLKQHQLKDDTNKGWEVYAEHCAKESYAALYVTTRADEHKRFGRDEWPERCSRPTLLDAPAHPHFDEDKMHLMLTTTSVDRRPAKESEVLARMGLDTPMVQSLGGLTAVLKLLPPATMAHYSRPELTGYIPLSLHWTDPAIRAWYGATGMSKVDKVERYATRMARYWPGPLLYGIDDDGTSPKIIYMAPNCGGKTHFNATHPWCVDSDKLVSSMGLHAELHFNSKHSVMQRSSMLTSTTEMLLLTRGYHALTTQLDPRDIIPPRAEREYAVHLVIVAPPQALLEVRMRARGWNAEKIARRIARWNAIKDRTLSDPYFLSEPERSSIKILTEFPNNI